MEKLMAMLLSLMGMLKLEEQEYSGEGIHEFLTWVNYDYEGEERRDQFLVVHIYQHTHDSNFINVWVDKLWRDSTGLESMGNGFIHKSLYTERDVLSFVAAVELAL